MRYTSLVGHCFDCDDLYYYHWMHDKWKVGGPIKGYKSPIIISHTIVDGTEYLEFTNNYFIRGTDLEEKYFKLLGEKMYEIY